MKILEINYLLILSLFLSIESPLFSQTVKQLPVSVSKEYINQIDMSVSDDFNGAHLDLTKWHRRNSGGSYVEDYVNDNSLVKMESEKEADGTVVKYVSIKGIGEDNKIRTAGIVSNYSAFYGFYVVKFRFRGLDTKDVADNKTIWHPSVWSGISDHRGGQVKGKKTTKTPEWLEIDFMEWSTSDNNWDCDAPARFLDSKGVKRKVITRGKGMEKGVIRKVHEEATSDWQTIGLEYNPCYLRLWRWNGSKWEEYGDRTVNFVDDNTETPEAAYTISTIGKKARSPQYWLLGNVVSRYLYDSIKSGKNKYSCKNMCVDFDYFRYYNHISLRGKRWNGKK